MKSNSKFILFFITIIYKFSYMNFLTQNFKENHNLYNYNKTNTIQIANENQKDSINKNKNISIIIHF
jgi:hypothetical protein